jgi:hypothetical protein
MGFIRMSDAMATSGTLNVTSYFLNYGDTDGGSTVTSSTGPAYRGFLMSHGVSTNQFGGRLCIMKGTVPVNFSTLTSFNAQSANVLVTFDSSANTGGGANNFIGTQDNSNPMVITTTYINAIASGTATWFWWFTSLANNTAWNNSDLPANQIVGTVGITGSGADLTLPSVAITSGNPYRIVNYRLQIPTEWTF